MLRTPLHVIRSNIFLARAVFIELGAYECAKAAFGKYPLPKENSAFWSSGSGILVRKLCEQKGMPVSLLGVSAQAAAVLLFDKHWRHDARKLVAARLVKCYTLASAVDGLMAVYIAENGGTRANARLQLMASHVHPLLFWPLEDNPVVAYMTYDADGVHIHLSTTLQVPSPTLPGWGSVQSELTTQEQLECAVLSNDLSATMQAVAYGQPICLPFDHSSMPYEACLRFCASCMISGPMTVSGESSGIRVCPKKECCYTEHKLCRSSQQCPKHNIPLVEVGLVTTCPAQAVPIVARGVVECKATWCVLVGDCRESAEHAPMGGMLHPASIDDCVNCADQAVKRGVWCVLNPDKGVGVNKQIVQSRFQCIAPFQKRLCEAFMRLESLNARLQATRRQVPSYKATVETPESYCIAAKGRQTFMIRPPGRAFTDLQSFGQVSTPVSQCPRFCTNLADALISLQVFSEPEFSNMCARFRNSPLSIDLLLAKWMYLKLPLLPGTISVQKPPLTAGEMHKTVAHSVLSACTKRRVGNLLREPRHWCVTQAEAVLPTSSEEDELFLQKLGLPAKLPPCVIQERQPATPDILNTVDGFAALGLSGYAVSAVRVIMNPSMHVSAVEQLQATAKGTFTGACLLSFLMCNEADPMPVSLTASCVYAFRAQCLRFSMYGRLFLLAIKNAEMIGLQWEVDPTGLLCCTAGCTAKDWTGDWTPVKQLCMCTGSSYVGLGAGSMLHWQQIAIAGQPSVLFENDLTRLLRIPESLLSQEQVYLVPCMWTGISAADLPMCNTVCVMHREGVSPIAYSQGCVTHMLSVVSSLKLPTATQFMGEFSGSAWNHYVSDQKHDTFALRALKCFHAMNKH